MNNKPLFSIVIPTRNKAAYLPYTIQSALTQTFEDFELIVNDNCSSDETQNVVKSFNDLRIRYFKTERALSMSESWENALSRAKGEYVTFLGDDDAHSHIYLESVKSIIEKFNARLISCAMGDYAHDEAYLFETNLKPNSLITSPFTNKLTTYTSREAIENVYSKMRLCKGTSPQFFHAPLLINAIYHKSIFSAARKKVPKFFSDVLSGDYYTAVLSLSVVDKLYVLDSPLSFHGLTKKSTTASIIMSTGGKSMKETQPEMTNIRNAPLKIISIPTFITDALLRAKADLKEEIEYIDIDLTAYLISSYHTLNQWESEGLEVSAEKAELHRIIDEQPFEIKESINAVLSLKSRIKERIHRNIRETKLYKLLLKIYSPRTPRPLLFESNRYGLGSLVDCSKMVGYEFLEKYGSK